MSNTFTPTVFTPTAGLPEINASGLCELARRAAVHAVIEHDMNALPVSIPGFRDAVIAEATHILFKLAFDTKAGPREDWDNCFEDLQSYEMERSLKALRVLRCVTDELHRLSHNAMDEMKESFEEQLSEINELAAKFGGETLVEDYPADWPEAAPEAV
jgi:hypothetical protein